MLVQLFTSTCIAVTVFKSPLQYSIAWIYHKLFKHFSLEIYLVVYRLLVPPTMLQPTLPHFFAQWYEYICRKILRSKLISQKRCTLKMLIDIAKCHLNVVVPIYSSPQLEGDSLTFTNNGYECMGNCQTEVHNIITSMIQWALNLNKYF